MCIQVGLCIILCAAAKYNIDYLQIIRRLLARMLVIIIIIMSIYIIMYRYTRIFVSSLNIKANIISSLDL